AEIGEIIDLLLAPDGKVRALSAGEVFSVWARRTSPWHSMRGSTPPKTVDALKAATGLNYDRSTAMSACEQGFQPPKAARRALAFFGGPGRDAAASRDAPHRWG